VNTDTVPLKKCKSVHYYFKLYSVLVIISLIIIGIGYLIRQQTLCANSKTCKSDLSVKIENNSMGIFQGHKIIPPKIDLSLQNLKSSPSAKPVLVKHIYVDLSKQLLSAYEGNILFMKTPISSGKWNRTPVGNFNIWIKLPATRMAGGEGADAYDLPNVPWVMYFFRDFGLHGAYWHDNFGYPMSHGCVNMRIVDAKVLYGWADGPTLNQLGTPVSVCSQFLAPDNCIQN
jgi:lipoprotein-anchoring transpeptidase ErfK/SrfK